MQGVVHNGEAVVEASIGEGFDTLLIQLRDDVLAHAEHEEREEFPLLRQTCDGQRRPGRRRQPACRGAAGHYGQGT